MRIDDISFDVSDLIESVRYDYQFTSDFALNPSALTKMTVRGDWLMMNCPNHNETNPSFGISLSSPYHCNCFYCGTLGTIDKMIELVLGLDKNSGLKYVMDSLGYYELTKIDLDRMFNQKKEIKNLPENDLVSFQKLENSLDYEMAIAYLKKRGLSDKTISTYGVGVDLKNYCITFPQRDRKGNLRFIQKRKINVNKGNRFINEGNPVKKDILFGLHFIDKIKTTKKAIKKVRIVESPIDVLSHYQIGEVAVALNGLILFPQQIRELQLSGVTTIELMLDNDKAGKSSTVEARSKLNKAGFVVNEVHYPNDLFKDANDLLLANELHNVKIKK